MASTGARGRRKNEEGREGRRTVSASRPLMSFGELNDNIIKGLTL